MCLRAINLIRNLRKKRYLLNEVFTPASSANIAYIDRPDIENKLSKSLDIIGKQIVIYGHSGSGKTTILAHVLRNKSIFKITSRCTTTSTMDSIILDAFDALNPYYVQNVETGKKSVVSGELSNEYIGIKSTINSSAEISTSETKTRVLPPQLTIQRLGEFIGQAKAMWIIEDFHKVDETEKTKISQTMKLFMDMAEKYPSTKIVVLGAAEHGSEVVAHDPELNNRVTEILVPLLDQKEIAQILVKGANALNVSFQGDLIDKVVSYSNCLATIAHQLAYNICYNSNIKKTCKAREVIPESKLPQAVSDFSNEKQDTYDQLYKTITKQRKGIYKNVEIILNTLSHMSSDDVTQNDLYAEILKAYPEYPQGNLSTYIKQLSSAKGEESLRYNSGRISFSDPFFKSYVKMLDYKTA